MPKFRFNGPLSLRLRSFLVLNGIALATYARHVTGRRMAPDWDANLEIGIRFWRHQHGAAMRLGDMSRARHLYDSLVTETDDRYEVDITHCPDPRGDWHNPRRRLCDTHVLHFHGGGYSFHGRISRRFTSMLAHRLGAKVFAPDYRLTPEHPHPAQSDDALAAYRHLLDQVPPDQIVLTGDSAGGHMALMLLQRLRAHGLPQPALCIGLCPWTDIGKRGASLTTNNRYDLVQGWMALQFGAWLDPGDIHGREALSPCFHDFSGLAPIYLQLGGRDILHDMGQDFFHIQHSHGARIACDSWPDMPHDFHAYDRLKTSSTEALTKLAAIVARRDLPHPPQSSA